MYTQGEIIDALQKNQQPVYASFNVSELFYMYFVCNPDGVGTHFRYGCEEVIMEKDNSMKTLVLVFVLLYFLSPVDAAPGILDDMIVAFMGMTLSRRSNQ